MRKIIMKNYKFICISILLILSSGVQSDDGVGYVKHFDREKIITRDDLRPGDAYGTRLFTQRDFNNLRSRERNQDRVLQPFYGLKFGVHYGIKDGHRKVTKLDFKKDWGTGQFVLSQLGVSTPLVCGSDDCGEIARSASNSKCISREISHSGGLDFSVPLQIFKRVITGANAGIGFNSTYTQGWAACNEESEVATCYAKADSKTYVTKEMRLNYQYGKNYLQNNMTLTLFNNSRVSDFQNACSAARGTYRRYNSSGNPRNPVWKHECRNIAEYKWPVEKLSGYFPVNTTPVEYFCRYTRT